jgi:hypothetical protein
VRLVIPLVSLYRLICARASVYIYLLVAAAIDLFTVSDVTFVASMHASLHLCLTLLAVHAVISVS